MRTAVIIFAVFSVSAILIGIERSRKSTFEAPDQSLEQRVSDLEAKMDQHEGYIEWLAIRDDSLIDRVDKLDGRKPHPMEGR